MVTYCNIINYYNDKYYYSDKYLLKFIIKQRFNNFNTDKSK